MTTYKIDHNYNLIATDSCGDQYLMYANRLHYEKLDHWQDWSCNAGYDCILIEGNLQVYSAQCENDFLGTLFEDFQLLDQPTVCRLPRCTNCTDDLLLTKMAPVK
jgi:hypothetical protein